MSRTKIYKIMRWYFFSRHAIRDTRINIMHFCWYTQLFLSPEKLNHNLILTITGYVLGTGETSSQWPNYQRELKGGMNGENRHFCVSAKPVISLRHDNPFSEILIKIPPCNTPLPRWMRNPHTLANYRKYSQVCWAKINQYLSK